jgi:fatty-acyl-CoA synthase
LDLGFNLIHRFNVADSLGRSAVRSPLQPAIEFLGRRLNYSEFEALVNRVARLLLEHGIERGDAVAILAVNSPEYAAMFFACGRIGAVLVPINLLFTSEEIDFLLEKTRVKALVVEPMFAAKVTRAPAIRLELDDKFRQAIAKHDSSPVERMVEDSDPLLIIFTSGTTARPKGVVLTHLNFYAYLLASYADYGVNREWKYLLALPMFHIAGLVLTFACFASGCESIIVPLPKPEPLLEAIARGRANILALPATVWVGLLQAPGIESADLSSLKRVFVFQYLPTPVFRKWRELIPGAEWVNCWGQTETTALGSTTPGAELGRMLSAPDPIGIQHMTLELRIVDEQMNNVAPGKPGEIVVRGPCVTPGYFEDAAANEVLFRDGWHHTGDIAYRDERGWLYFLDRKKDMIKSGGENVSSQEVEEAIAQHPAVAEVAVVGVHDDYWIEKVVACVVPMPGTQPKEEDLLAHARSRLAAFKVPKQVFIMAEFPKNPTGKVLKRVLREKLAGEQAGGASV